MKTTTPSILSGFIVLLMLVSSGFGQTIYNQATVSALATGTNLVEKSATPTDAATFRNAVATAWTNDSGGVFSLPTTVAGGTTVYRATYGTSNGKRMQITTSVPMQNSNAGGGTIYPISNPNVTTPNANQSDYSMAMGVFDVVNGLPLPNEAIKQIGFVILSRTSANFPLDLLATVTFSDGSTQAVTSTIGNGRGVDDTFFGFTAPNGLSIVNLRLQSFSPGTQTPVADRVSWDDFGFITGPSFVTPQPQILNATPIGYAIHNPTSGIQFEALTYVSIDPTNVSLVLNGNDVSSQLVFTGNSTNYSVSFLGLLANQEYQMTITVTSPGGTATLNRTFYTQTNPFVLYDAEGFTSDELYPVGLLQPVTHGRGTWIPNPSEPAEIVDRGDSQGKVLQRMATGASRPDYLNFPPVSSGTLTVEFDAFASTTVARTFDISLSAQNSGQMGCFLAWGEASGKLAYFDNVNWLPLADLQSDWHHCKIVNYLSGPAAGRYDVFINGVLVGDRLAWRNAPVGTPFGQLRFHTQNTAALLETGQIDNLVITAGPENTNVFLPPSILNIQPFAFAISKPSNGIQFETRSLAPLDSSNISLILNSNNVSSQLQFTGNTTNKFASFTNLLANQTYFMEISVSNAGGMSVYTNTFYTYTNDVVLYDSGGFTDDALYPIGPLGAVTSGGSSWGPAAQPGEIVDSVVAPYGKVLRRAQTGPDQIDNLRFPPIASGVITYSFDVRVSNPAARTVDFSLMTSGGTMASFMMLGSNTVNSAQFGGTFMAVTNLDGAWHHFEAVNYLSGPNANSHDLYMDGVLLGKKLDWRATIAAQTPLSRLRVGAIRGTVSEYGDVDNLVVTAGPERIVTSIAPLSLLNPARAGSNFTFTFQSQQGINHEVQYKQNLGQGGWTALQTIVGDGTMKTVVHTNPPVGTLFYRISSQ